jgi:hypothetical protein
MPPHDLRLRFSRILASVRNESLRKTHHLGARTVTGFRHVNRSGRTLLIYHRLPESLITFKPAEIVIV